MRRWAPSQKKVNEPAAFATPNRAASVDGWRTGLQGPLRDLPRRDGFGLLATNDKRRGYVFPPLWGPDSFNDGAGMHRVLTAARFIKARMPLGEADLTDDEAFDVAAFINAQPRPVDGRISSATTPTDRPSRSTTATARLPIRSPLEQHRLGPFQPIEAFYKAKKASK